mmetsp:Transcript_9451/g.29540  ORF Transcript_9451/g.29540 Transcript_9451/m.29540 type:complete len:217 (-) Transcript_9451:275-925(-)
MSPTTARISAAGTVVSLVVPLHASCFGGCCGAATVAPCCDLSASSRACTSSGCAAARCDASIACTSFGVGGACCACCPPRWSCPPHCCCTLRSCCAWEGKTVAMAKIAAAKPTSSPLVPSQGSTSFVSGSCVARSSPFLARLTPSPSCMPRIMDLGVRAAMAPMRPLTPSTSTMPPVSTPAASASSSVTSSAMAIAAMDFIGCTGMGMRNAKAVYA